MPRADAAAPASGRGLDDVVPGNVRALRTARGWRQQDLAVAAGWSRAAVVDVEEGRRRLTLRDAAVLCRVLHVPLAALLDGADDTAVLGLGAPEPLDRG